MLCEATRTHQTRVVWGGCVRIDELAGARVHPITPDQERAFCCGAILEGRDHALRIGREIDQFLAKGNRDSLAFGFLTQHLVQARAQDIDAWGSYFGPGTIANLAKTLAVSTPDYHARNRRSQA